MTEPRIAVFRGGLSGEHDVSLNSGKKVLETIAATQPVDVVIGRDNRWKVDGIEQRSPAAAIDLIKDRADLVFLALHGPFGEDGTVQGFLEAQNIPYTGSGVMASALAMDKPRTKMVYRHKELLTPEFAFFTKNEWKTRRPIPNVGYPCVVKPARLGSSVGISFPKTETELVAAIDKLFESTDDVIVERFVKGREMTCGVLSIARETRTFSLPVTEIVPDQKYSFFDYTAKYTPGASEEITPARITPEASREIQRMALEAHELLGCRDFSRSDFMLTDEGRVYILETNTIPGLTATSLLPQGAAAIGMDYATLINVMIENAWMRRRSPTAA
jgi:D-alanine-D-alanine ligase